MSSVSTVSGDGAEWSEPVALEGTYGHYIWRAAAHGGKAYLCGRRKAGFTEKESGSGVSPVPLQGLSAFGGRQAGCLPHFRAPDPILTKSPHHHIAKSPNHQIARSPNRQIAPWLIASPPPRTETYLEPRESAVFRPVWYRFVDRITFLGRFSCLISRNARGYLRQSPPDRGDRLMEIGARSQRMRAQTS